MVAESSSRVQKGIDAVVAAVAIQPDGKLVLAGGSGDFLVARLLRSGSLDPEFGVGGLAWIGFRGTRGGLGYSLALTPDAGMFVGGLVPISYHAITAIARFEGGPGPADLDGDGVGDASDGCPRTFGSHSSGCPTAKLELKSRVRSGSIRGRVRVRQTSGETLKGERPGENAVGSCLSGRPGKAVLLERRRGSDRKVDVDRQVESLRLSADGPGTYYVRIRSRKLTALKANGPFVLCSGLKSKLIRIGP